MISTLAAHGEAQNDVYRLKAQVRRKKFFLRTNAVCVSDRIWKVRVGWARRLAIAEEGNNDDTVVLERAIGEVECLLQAASEAGDYESGLGLFGV